MSLNREGRIISVTREQLIERRFPILEYIIRNFNYALGQDIINNGHLNRSTYTGYLNELHESGILLKGKINRNIIYSISPRYYNTIEQMVYPGAKSTQHRYDFDPKATIRSMFACKLYNHLGRELYNSAKYLHIFNKENFDETDPPILTANFYNLYFTLDDPNRFFIFDMRFSHHYMLERIEKIGKVMTNKGVSYTIDIITYNETRKNYFEKRVLGAVEANAASLRVKDKYNYGPGHRLIYMNIINLNVKNFLR